MATWPSTKARRVLAALLRIGWTVKRHNGTSHRVLEHPDFSAPYIFAFHDDVEVGPVLLSKIAKKTGLKLADL